MSVAGCVLTRSSTSLRYSSGLTPLASQVPTREESPGDVVAGVFIPDEEVVLAAERDDAEGGLGAVVVGPDACVTKKLRERLPVLQRVAHGDRHVALRRIRPLPSSKPELELMWARHPPWGSVGQRRRVDDGDGAGGSASPSARRIGPARPGSGSRARSERASARSRPHKKVTRRVMASSCFRVAENAERMSCRSF
jgi:hypothetical protein